MISENKLIQQRADDELSTSAGSSDNEVAVTSEDEVTTVPTQAEKQGNTRVHSLSLGELLVKFIYLFLEFLDFLRSLVLRDAASSKRRLKVPSASYPRASNKRNGILQQRRPLPSGKAPKAQKAQWPVTKSMQCKPLHASTYGRVSCPPGLEHMSQADRFRDSVAPAHQIKPVGQSLSLDEVGFPPGLEAPSHPVGQSFSLEEIGLPPGLEVPSHPAGQSHSLDEVGLPPGLEHMWANRAQAVQQSTTWSQQKHASITVQPGPRKQQCSPIGMHQSAKQNKRGERPKQNKPKFIPPQSVKPPLEQPLPQEPVQPVTHSPEPLVPREFDLAAYRKELSGVLHDLANGSNVAIALRRIRAHKVPKERQAAEFCDILTRAAEDERGLARRLALAFAMGLAKTGENSAFDREECIAGLQLFFADVVDDLAMEVPRLRNRLSNELAPLLLTILSEEELERYVPVDCRTPCN
jgi:hypothetical protein